MQKKSVKQKAKKPIKDGNFWQAEKGKYLRHEDKKRIRELEMEMEMEMCEERLTA